MDNVTTGHLRLLTTHCCQYCHTGCVMVRCVVAPGGAGGVPAAGAASHAAVSTVTLGVSWCGV